jgi:hypothetical protein
MFKDRTGFQSTRTTHCTWYSTSTGIPVRRSRTPYGTLPSPFFLVFPADQALTDTEGRTRQLGRDFSYCELAPEIHYKMISFLPVATKATSFWFLPRVISNFYRIYGTVYFNSSSSLSLYLTLTRPQKEPRILRHDKITLWV